MNALENTSMASRGDNPTIKTNIKISIVLKSYVRLSLVNRNRKKDAGTDGILIEMLSVLDNFGFQQITEIIIEKYQSREKLSGYIFIMVPKKTIPYKSEHYQIIILTSIINKHMIKFLTNRAH